MRLCFLFFCILIVTLTGYVDAKVDCIEIIKHKRELSLIENDKVIKTYRISLGRQPKGHKREENDGRTPEGSYFVARKITNSSYHRYLQISYPSPEERAQAQKRNINPGGRVYIHGVHRYFSYLPDFLLTCHRWYDWTNGGIGLTNVEIDEIFDQVDVGTPVIIFS